MDSKQSKNFFAQLVEDLPATATNDNGQPGKSIAKPFLRETADSTLRIEVWNYTSTPYLKGDIVVVNVDNFGICRVVDALSDSGMYVSNSGNNGLNVKQRPNLNKMIYATGDASANQLASINVSVNNTISPQTKRNQYANPFNFRAGPPTLFANVHGFGYCYTDGAGANDQNKAYKMAEGMIPVAQDARLHFRIPANDTKVYNYGDAVFVAPVAGSTVFEICQTASVYNGGAVVAICDSEKNAAVDYDFYMPFKLAGTLSSIDEQAGVSLGSRYGYSRDNNGDDDVDATRGDFYYTLGGQKLYSPVYVQQYRVTAGTSYPVAVYFDGNTVNPFLVDIPLTEAQWLSLYGRGTLKPEICDGDTITCLVDASPSTPHITPISFPMDYGENCVMFWNSAPSARLWVNVPDSTVNVNWQPGDIGVFGGGWFNTVALDPNGTELNLRSMGGWYQKQRDNSVLVMGNW